MTSSIDPTVHFALVVFAFAALGLWAIPFRATRGQWRFELFSVDFALGSFLFALPAVLVFGNFGTDLPFSDRLLVSSRTSQAMMLAAGFFFGVGSTLLLGAVSLVGLAGAFTMGGAMGLLLSTLLRTGAGSGVLMSAVAVLSLVAVVLSAIACSSREGRVPRPPSVPRSNYQPPARRLRRSTKGILVGVLGGLTVAACYPLATRGIFDDFGMGPYAGLFLFCIGILVGNLIFSLYFFNIALDGAALPLRSYLKGWPGRHIAGIAAGVLFAAGALAVALTRDGTAPNAVASPSSSMNSLPLASVLLPITLGLILWKEFGKASRIASLLQVAATLCVALGILALIRG